MNEYTDLQVIECNRLHSEEAKSGNDSNFALWTTNLTDIVHLDAGDKVSVHGAMISERGAGQSSSIEIKGVNLGTKKTFNYTVIDYGNASTHLPSGYDRISCNASSQEVYMRDDTLNFVLEYYQTARAQNYIHLPRKWWYNPSVSQEGQFIGQDNKFNGMSNYFYIIEKDPFSFNQEYYALDDGLGPDDGGTRYFKPKNNNGRYTIMMRDNTYYDETLAEGKAGGWNDDFTNEPTNYNEALGRSRDPENTTYRIYKEFKSIKLPAGFNSPEYIADEVTRQLQTITDETIHKYGYISDSTPADLKEQPVPFYRTISTETYKPFNVANTFRSIHTHNSATDDYSVIRTGFTQYYNGSLSPPRSNNNNAGFDYLYQYHIVGTKRPELYETGRQINNYETDALEEKDGGIFGVPLRTNWLHTSDTFVLKQKYTKENVDKLKAFFDAQSKYPEIFDYFKDADNEYNDADNINNSRWIHMNRWDNASMTYTDENDEAMLGDSYYTDRSGSMEDVRVHSLLLPIYYDNSVESNKFFELKASTDGTDYSYGLISYDSLGYIKLKSTPNNGVGSALWTELQQDPTDNYVAARRKCGFDLHFTAPAMKYILPYAGYSPNPGAYQDATQIGDYSIKPIDYWSGATYLDGSVFMNKLYLGADAPKLEFDGTNFNLNGLHTPINVPNHNRVNNPSFSIKPDAEQFAGDIIYEINPKEYFNDFTPERKPYVQIDSVKSGSGANAIVLNPLNINLQPWQVYDSMCGVFIKDFNLNEEEWSGSLWDLLGFTYEQFNSGVNNRLTKTDSQNINSLSILTTNAEVDRADSKVYVQNSWETPLYNNMIPNTAQIYVTGGSNHFLGYYHPNIQLKTTSNKIRAEKLPTRMIRGYYTIRSNVLQETSFIGGKKNNTQMPIISVVDKQNGDGDFYFGTDSGLEFTITKPVRLASITCSVHDPDGSYANVSEQSTVLLKVQKSRNVSFNVVEELLQQEQQQSSK